jgi:hypothetical protein
LLFARNETPVTLFMDLNCTRLYIARWAHEFESHYEGRTYISIFVCFIMRAGDMHFYGHV